MAINLTLTDSEGKNWDLQGVNPIGSRFPGQTGQGVQGGTADAYDGGIALAVGTDLVNSTGTLVNPSASSLDENGRELNTGPVVIAGVAVTRSFLVSDSTISANGFMRTLDSFTNTTTQVITILVQILSDVGSDNSTACIASTSGNAVIDTADHGFVTDEVANQTGGDSSVGFVYGDGIGLGASNARSSLVAGEGVDEITVQFQLTLQPGETQRLLSYAFQNTTGAQGVADLTQYDDNLSVLDNRGFLAGISAAERAQIVNYSEPVLPAGLTVKDGSGQEWNITESTARLSTLGTNALQTTRIDDNTTPLADFTVLESAGYSENGQEATLVYSSTDPAQGEARVSHSVMASPDSGFARYLVTVSADPVAGFNLTGESIGLFSSVGVTTLIGARDLATGTVSTTLDITDSGLVFDDSASGAGGTEPALTVVWGDFSMGDAVDGLDAVKTGTASVRQIYDDLNLAAGQSASFLYFFATNPDAGMGLGDLGNLSTPDFRALAGLSAAEVASIINFTLDESDRLETVLDFTSGDDTYAGDYWGELMDGGDGQDVMSGGGSDDRILGGAGDDTLDGGTGDDEIEGGSGNDLIEGGGGNDVMRGGTEDDTYMVDSAGDTIVEFAGAGFDIVHSTVSFTLATNVEGLVLIGNATINAVGNTLDNFLKGNAGKNVLNGGAGNDTMIGGAGNDIYIVNALGDQVFETITTTSTIDAGGIDTVQSTISFNLDASAGVRFVERLTLTGAGNINASGNALANLLTGNAGNNLVDGGAGIDTMIGGAGNDTYVVERAGEQVFETTTTASNVDAGGTDLVQSAVTFNLDASNGVRFVEQLTLTGSANINATGNALANTLTGNAGVNQLDGGVGADIMLGGAGNDVYIVDLAGDQVFETTTTASAVDAGGIDTVKSAVSFSLATGTGVSFVERLTLTGVGNINGTGNGLVNLLTGNAGNNQLNGGAGNDSLSGGAGNDSFIFDTSIAIPNIDTITDFNPADDTLRLDDAIFFGLAGGTLSGSAFAINLTGFAALPSDRIIYETDTGRLFFDSDGSGSAARVHFATPTPNLALTDADFFVF